MIIEERTPAGTWAAIRIIVGRIPAARDDIDVRFKAHDRNYRRFAALAGVRGTGPTPRGFPPDVSESVRLMFKKYGGHTPSWLPIAEAATIFANTQHDMPVFVPANALDYVYYFFGVDTDGAEQRLVFWFDS